MGLLELLIVTDKEACMYAGFLIAAPCGLDGLYTLQGL